MAVNRKFWLDRPTLVTGATGLVGSWLTARLVDAGADVVCLVRDWIPQSEMIRSGVMESVKTVRGDVCDRDLIERTLGEYEIHTVVHLAAQTIVGVANRNPDLDFREQYSRDVELTGGMQKDAQREGRSVGVVR